MLFNACSASFHFLQATTSQNVLTRKFTINQLHVNFITKDCKRHYKVVQLKVVITNWDRYYKAGQLLFKSGAMITKQYRQKINERDGGE